MKMRNVAVLLLVAMLAIFTETATARPSPATGVTDIREFAVNDMEPHRFVFMQPQGAVYASIPQHRSIGVTLKGAKAGKRITYRTFGFAYLELAGSVFRGTPISPTADGKGIAFDLTQVAHRQGAIAWEDGEAGDIILVLVVVDIHGNEAA